MPIISRPFLPYFFFNEIKSGIPFLQGGHQVAQKSIITALPLKSDNDNFLPSAVGRVKSGATVELFSVAGT